MQMRKRGLLIILLGVLTLTTLGCGRQSSSVIPKYVDIQDVVKTAFLTDKGYTDEISKYMSKEVFTRINLYKDYPVNRPEYSKPFNIDFNIREQSEKKKSGIVYVNMVYSVTIKDSKNTMVGGAKDAPITFTVQLGPSGWYITQVQEEP
ncbi:hypothetical protein CEB3_c20830 [Peptococcaceae bacterium CEB3]|nr:hypothetical protein CEB3_c20830 [Peptococcaceae bacterium CEB3]